MTADEVLLEVRRRGINLSVVGSTIAYRAPRGSVTPQLKVAVESHREAILAILRNGAVRSNSTIPGVPQCGSSMCDGCYEIQPGVRLHPLKSSVRWRDWLAHWQADGKIQ